MPEENGLFSQDSKLTIKFQKEMVAEITELKKEIKDLLEEIKEELVEIKNNTAG